MGTQLDSVERHLYFGDETVARCQNSQRFSRCRLGPQLVMIPVTACKCGDAIAFKCDATACKCQEWYTIDWNAGVDVDGRQSHDVPLFLPTSQRKGFQTSHR